MRKKAEKLVVGRVYADREKNTKNIKTTFFEYIGNQGDLHLFKIVGGCREFFPYDVIIESNLHFWYELSPEEDALYNKPSDTTDGWVKCSDRLPEARKEVIAFGVNLYGKKRIIKARYIHNQEILAEDFYEDYEGEYNEEKNQWYAHCGWYEYCHADDKYWNVDFITHWRELPEPPKS